MWIGPIQGFKALGRDSFQIETIGENENETIIQAPPESPANFEEWDREEESLDLGGWSYQGEYNASGPLRSPPLIFIHGNVSAHGSGSDNYDASTTGWATVGVKLQWKERLGQVTGDKSRWKVDSVVLYTQLCR